MFLQARCPSCHPTNSVKALKALAHSAFGLERRCYSSPQRCYLHHLHIFSSYITIKIICSDNSIPSSLVSKSVSASTNCRRLLPLLLWRPAYNRTVNKLDEHGSAGSPQVVLHLFQKRTSGFLWLGCPPVIQPSLSKHWWKRKALTLTSSLASSFLHPPPAIGWLVGV